MGEYTLAATVNGMRIELKFEKEPFDSKAVLIEFDRFLDRMQDIRLIQVHEIERKP